MFFTPMGPSMLKIYALIELERGLDKICHHCLCTRLCVKVGFGITKHVLR